MRKSRFTESQIVGILKEGEAGVPLADLVRKHGISRGSSTGGQRRQGTLAALRAKKRGRKADPVNPLAPRVAQAELR